MNGKSTEVRQQSRNSSQLTKAALHLAALSRTYRGCSKRVLPQQPQATEFIIREFRISVVRPVYLLTSDSR